MPRSSRALAALVSAASLTTLLTVLTAVVPDWIEVLFEAEPDGGSGSLEWLLVGAMLLVSVVLWAGAWRVLHHRRTGPATAGDPGSG